MKWYLDKKINYYPFDIYLANFGYTKIMSKNLGWGFKNTLYYYHSGYEDSYRGEKDMQELKDFLYKKFNKKFVDHLGEKIKKRSNQLLIITKMTFVSKKTLQKNFHHFCKAFCELFGIFQLPNFCQILLSDQDEKLLVKFGITREYSAKRILEAEKIYRKRLGELTGIPSQKALFLLPGEILNFIKTGYLPENFKERKRCLILTRKNKFFVFWNKKADQIFS